MARPRRASRGSVYQKRRLPSPVMPQSPVDGLSSSDARRLAEQIDASQERFRVTAIRLIADRACGVVLVDRLADGDQMVTSLDEWNRLQRRDA